MGARQALFLAFLSRVAGAGFRLRSVACEPDLRIVFDCVEPRAARSAVEALNAGDWAPADLRAFKVPVAEAALRLRKQGLPEPASPAGAEVLLWEYRGALGAFDRMPVFPPAPVELEGPLPVYACGGCIPWTPTDPANADESNESSAANGHAGSDIAGANGCSLRITQAADETTLSWLVRERAGRAPLHVERDAARSLFFSGAAGPVLTAAGGALADAVEAAVRDRYRAAGFEEFRPLAGRTPDPVEYLRELQPFAYDRLPYRFFQVDGFDRPGGWEPGMGLYAAPSDRIDRAFVAGDLVQMPLVAGDLLSVIRDLATRFDVRLEVAALSAGGSTADDAGLGTAARQMARAHGFSVTGERPGPRPGLDFAYLDPAGRRFRGPRLEFERESGLYYLDRAGRERRAVLARLTATGGILRLLAASLEGNRPPLAAVNPAPAGGRP